MSQTLSTALIEQDLNGFYRIINLRIIRVETFVNHLRVRHGQIISQSVE